MKKIMTDEAIQDRAAIDGRVAFAAAAFAVVAGFVVLLDRIGMPERLVALLGPIFAVTGLAVVGLLLRSMRISSFYAAGRATPAVYAGLAMAALGAALFAPFTPPVPEGTSLTGLLVGFGLGLALAALGTGPLLRKTGAFSLVDLITARFPHLTLRIGVVFVVGVAGLCVGLAGFSSALTAFSQANGAGRDISLLIVGAAIVFVATPGGIAGLVWSATGAAAMLVAGLCLPLAMLLLRGASLPLPGLGDRAGFEQALARLATWNGSQSMIDQGAGTLSVVAIVLGLAALGPLLAPATTTRDRAQAHRSGMAGLFWCAVIVVVALASMAASTLALEAGAAGLQPADMPDFLLKASHSGFVALCGQHPGTVAELRAACSTVPGFTGSLRAEDVSATGAYLILGVADLRGFSSAYGGLAAAGAVAISIVLAAGGFLTLGTALGHDAFYRVGARSALTSRRLAVTRFIILLAIVGSGALLARHAPDPRVFIGFAIALCAVAITPLLLLSFWPRAEGMEATVALLVGLASAEAVLLFDTSVESVGLFANASVVGCAAATLVGFLASLLRRADPTSHGNAFVHALLHGENDVLHPDKGA